MGHVYLLIHPGLPGWVKLGSTNNVHRRIAQYQTGDPFRSYQIATVVEHPYAEAVEQEALANIEEQGLEVRGEWVRASVWDLLSFIQHSTEAVHDHAHCGRRDGRVSALHDPALDDSAGGLGD